ncbi:hypothetical protein TNCV_774491 [Trichonephila clavipes]|nr:hypothetical protein TNCV_774491 [Trichonephila clavipes]
MEPLVMPRGTPEFHGTHFEDHCPRATQRTISDRSPKVRVDELIQGASTCKKICALSGSIASEASIKNLKTLKRSPLGSPRWLPGGGEGNDLNGNWVMASRSYQDLQVGGAFP